MRHINAIIIDDEAACTESLSLELQMYCPQVNILSSCHSAAEGLSSIVKFKPDLVFLDIEMPRMNGFELLNQLKQINFEVIFVTAYDQFALKAFKFSAIDYLLKPIVYEDLIAAVNKVEQRIIKNLGSDHLEALLSNINFLNKNLSTIAVPSLEGLEFVPVEEINYCEAQVNYTSIHKTDGSSILLSKTLKNVESMLENHQFIRIHQSYLINIAHLKKYIRGQGGYVIMRNGANLPVSRNKKDDFISKISNV